MWQLQELLLQELVELVIELVDVANIELVLKLKLVLELELVLLELVVTRVIVHVTWFIESANVANIVANVKHI